MAEEHDPGAEPLRYEELRRASESELATEHERVLGVIESIMAGLCVTDLDGTIQMTNLEAGGLIGISSEELAGQRLWEAFTVGPPRDVGVGRRLFDEAGFAAAMASGQPWRSVAQFTRPDGERFFAGFGLNPIGDPPVGAVFVYFDVTPNVEAQAATERLTTLLEAATDVVAVCEPSGHLLHLNRVGGQYSGI
jgi:PAS domain S-box-containing protein